MRTPASSRGGSTPPRPPAGTRQQRFVLRPWSFDVTAATALLRAAPRPPQPLPVMAWARAYGLLPAPGGSPHTISLIGPGPGFDPGYAMGTDLDEPVIVATITGPDGEPAGPLLIDGCHRLYKAARTGRDHLPSHVLTAAETRAIRHLAILGPSRAAFPRTRPWRKPVTAYRLNRFTMTDAEALAGATADITEWADDELESRVTYRAARITGISGQASPHLILATTGAQVTDARTGSVLGTRPAEPEWHVMFTWICEVTNICPAGAPARPSQARHPGAGAVTVTVTIWHNIAVDAHGRHTAMLDGYQPGDPVVAVFTYQADPAGRTAEQIADEAFDIFNDHPRNPEGEELARRYYRHRLLRSLAIGDVVVIGEAALAAGRPAGWTPASGGLNESRADQHGTHPLPDPGRLSDTGT